MPRGRAVRRGAGGLPGPRRRPVARLRGDAPQRRPRRQRVHRVAAGGAQAHDDRARRLHRRPREARRGAQDRRHRAGAGHRLRSRTLRRPLPELQRMVTGGERVQAALPRMRAGLDSGQVDALTGFDFYNEMLDLIGISAKRLSASADDAVVAFEHVVSSDLFFVIESVARGHALALYALGDPGVRDRLAAQVNQYRQPPTAVFAHLTDDERARAARLVASRDWAALLAGDQAVLAGAPLDRAAWQRAAGAVLAELSALYLSHSWHTIDLAEERGRTALRWSVIAGAVLALVAALAVAAAYRSASGLIGRLKDLRRRTLDLSENELPALIGKIGSGAEVDPAVVRLDFGRDELGEVAQAFEKAQQVAISTAVAEAETKQGVRAVFLNIAHRSQVIVHRQLEELDQLERSEDDPDTVDRLFRVDHLATRIRRNAENLIILGGEQVGRGWREPVALRDVIRGAISETKHYKRATVLPVPGVRLEGAVVADVGHLLAELVDNGTSFSPPESRVEVRGVVVGRGIVVEIEDQGLGMTEDQLDRLNRMLREPRTSA
ncbi:nitrate- and nitrite sensing domain-containing protein [Actinokineospora soli]|uniref:histidine kinase n=1 Tax=Actinokineospora soli TaxID=1048753 RepID=A0ABW2TR83_9PSEU